MKNLKTINPDALWTVPASAVGIAPTKSIAANVILGPNRSHAAPAVSLTINVAVKARMLEFAI